MADIPGSCDVAVVGGGPGGSTLGALLALQGRRVCIVEREGFPRFRVGESLLPFGMDVLRRTGVLPKITDAGFMVKNGARFVVDDTLDEMCFWFRNGLDGEHPSAFQVQRAPFDKLLLDHARELGVEVHQPVTARDFDIDADGATLHTDAGDIHAQVLCDASGRWTFTSSRMKQRRVHPDHRKIAAFGHFRNVVRCEQDTGNIIIVRFGDAAKGWFWLIPFSDGTNSVGVVADGAYFRGLGMAAEEFFWKSIHESNAMAPRMKAAEAITEIRSEADFSYTSERLVGDRLIKLGDAGAFIDPIFSSGVFLSTEAADAAAMALGRAFERGDFGESAFADYERHVRRGTEVFWAFIEAFYDRDFLKQMVTSRRRPLMQTCLTSLLAGDVYNDDNQLIQHLTARASELPH